MNRILPDSGKPFMKKERDRGKLYERVCFLNQIEMCIRDRYIDHLDTGSPDCLEINIALPAADIHALVQAGSRKCRRAHEAHGKDKGQDDTCCAP